MNHLVSLFASSKVSGHSIDDDIFYFGCCLQSCRKFTLYTPRYSVDQLLNRFKEVEETIQEIPVFDGSVLSAIKISRMIDVSKGDRVIFLGYSEKFLFVFYLVKLLQNYSLNLVATNNFSAGRVAKYIKELKFLFWLFGSKIHRLIVHTEYEKKLVGRISKSVFSLVAVKKHHLMISREPINNDIDHSNPLVSFFGPAKSDKPLEPFVQLVQGDKFRKFRYRIYRMKSDALLQAYPCLNQDNVEIFEGWLSEREYSAAFSSSTLVFMSHNESFEGKLSGIFCDCIGLKVSFISAAIEPVVSFMEKYGEIGFTCDFGKLSWVKNFLAKYDVTEVTVYQKRLRAISRDFEIAAVQEDSIRALLD
jgi:hypothetical protein